MNIDEAIRVNTVLKEAPVLKDDPRIIAALNLNIEALKKWKDYRACDKTWWGNLLPGETED